MSQSTLRPRYFSYTTKNMPQSTLRRRFFSIRKDRPQRTLRPRFFLYEKRDLRVLWGLDFFPIPKKMPQSTLRPRFFPIRKKIFQGTLSPRFFPLYEKMAHFDFFYKKRSPELRLQLYLRIFSIEKTYSKKNWSYGPGGVFFFLKRKKSFLLNFQRSFFHRKNLSSDTKAVFSIEKNRSSDSRGVSLWKKNRSPNNRGDYFLIPEEFFFSTEKSKSIFYPQKSVFFYRKNLPSVVYQNSPRPTSETPSWKSFWIVVTP